MLRFKIITGQCIKMIEKWMLSRIKCIDTIYWKICKCNTHIAMSVFIIKYFWFSIVVLWYSKFFFRNTLTSYFLHWRWFYVKFLSYLCLLYQINKLEVGQLYVWTIFLIWVHSKDRKQCRRDCSVVGITVTHWDFVNLIEIRH